MRGPSLDWDRQIPPRSETYGELGDP